MLKKFIFEKFYKNRLIASLKKFYNLASLDQSYMDFCKETHGIDGVLFNNSPTIQLDDFFKNIDFNLSTIDIGAGSRAIEGLLLKISVLIIQNYTIMSLIY